MIDGFETLAASLGADVDDPKIAANKAAFEKSRDRFKDVVAEQKGLTTLGGRTGRRHALRRRAAVLDVPDRLQGLGSRRHRPRHARTRLSLIGSTCRGRRPTSTSPTCC